MAKFGLVMGVGVLILNFSTGGWNRNVIAVIFVVTVVILLMPSTN